MDATSNLHSLISNRHYEDQNLYTIFKEITDFRRRQGLIHELSIILIIITMAIMSGYNGQRAMGDFVEKHKEDLIKLLNPNKDV